MDYLSIVLRGFVIGFSVAAPVGPIGILCIRRTLAEGRLVGFLSGLGAATADMVYGATAAFGLVALTEFLLSHKDWFRLIGGSFLLFLGVKTMVSKPSQTTAKAQQLGLVGAFLSTLILTISNPMTILSFVAIFSALLPSAAALGSAPVLLVLGVFLGSAGWWLALSVGVDLLRKTFAPTWMVWVNRAAGAMICAFGLLAMAAIRRS